ncbi:MAG: Na/Pi symporter, partial [Lachnospiraceae bacterium]|nr:Na/Pi symporter [Lachnospiraceae bacterium]
ITAQIIAFKLSDYIYLIIFAGFIIAFISKRQKSKNIGQTIFAFGLLFLGIETMGEVMKPLAGSQIFLSMIDHVKDVPVLGVLVGTLMTLVVQSSSATIAVLQNFAVQTGEDGVSSVIGLAGAIPILLGDNIGTTITALLASIGQNKDAKRTAVAHCIFNLSGSFVFIWLIKPFAAFIRMISPAGPEVEVISRQIANAHTAFNLVMTLVWTPLIPIMVKIVMRLVPSSGDENRSEAGERLPKYLDARLVEQPAAALELAAKEVLHYSEMVRALINDTANAVRDGGKELLDEITVKCATVSKLNGQINDYLAGMFAAGVLTEKQTNQTAEIMYMLCDVDRIALLCGDIANSVNEQRENKYKYSKEAMKDLEKSLKTISDMFSVAIEVMKNGDEESIRKIRRKKEKALDLDMDIRKAHMKRVSKGKCEAKLTAPFNSILHSVDRMGNCCVNIAEAALERVDFSYFINMTRETLSEA